MCQEIPPTNSLHSPSVPGGPSLRARPSSPLVSVMHLACEFPTQSLSMLHNHLAGTPWSLLLRAAVYCIPPCSGKVQGQQRPTCASVLCAAEQHWQSVYVSLSLPLLRKHGLAQLGSGLQGLHPLQSCQHMLKLLAPVMQRQLAPCSQGSFSLPAVQAWARPQTQHACVQEHDCPAFPGLWI